VHFWSHQSSELQIGDHALGPARASQRLSICRLNRPVLNRSDVFIRERQRRLLRLVLRDGAKIALFVIASGIAGALALTRLMASLLFEVKPTDPATFAGVAILLALVALAACYIPARRAIRVDPMVALRYE
jgi:hypothetical protein